MKVIKFIFSLASIVVLLILGWAIFTSMIKVFGDYTSSVEPTIIVAIISGLGAIIVNAISKSNEQKSLMLEKSKDKMSIIYENFLASLFDTKDKKEAAAIFSQYKSVFAVNSSGDTYNEFLKLQLTYVQGKMINTDQLIIAIRKELKISTRKRTIE